MNTSRKRARVAVPRPKVGDTQAAQLPERERLLTDAQEAELLAWGEHIARQPHPPRFKDDGKGALTGADGVDLDLHSARVVAAFGSADSNAINLLSCQAAETSEGSTLATKYNTAAALAAGIGPRNEIEAMLAVQMIGCHNTAMAMLRRASKTDRVDFLTIYGNLAAKLFRTFTQQTEALARLRGQTGDQTVRVEHVTVQAGGQAVVGAVNTGGRRCEQEQPNNPIHRNAAD